MRYRKTPYRKTVEYPPYRKCITVHVCALRQKPKAIRAQINSSTSLATPLSRIRSKWIRIHTPSLSKPYLAQSFSRLMRTIARSLHKANLLSHLNSWRHQVLRHNHALLVRRTAAILIKSSTWHFSKKFRHTQRIAPTTAKRRLSSLQWLMVSIFQVLCLGELTTKTAKIASSYSYHNGKGTIESAP